MNRCVHGNQVDKLTFALHSLVNQTTACTIHCQHVEIDATNLGVEVVSNRAACSYIRLHDIADDLDDFRVLEAYWVLVCLGDDVVPLDIC